MSFAINPSLTHIDIPEGDILEIFRSKGAIQLTDARFRGHPCEAFICIFRREKSISATVAILETIMNSIFVYSSDYFTDQSQEISLIQEDALAFTSSFGFTMDRVNLDFSPAMREVIIKGIKAMKPPHKRTKLRSLNNTSHLDPVAPVPSSVRSSAVPVSTVSSPNVIDSVNDQTEITALKKELSSARAVIEKLTREKLDLTQSATNQIATLKSSLENALEAQRIAEKSLQNEIEAKSKSGQDQDSEKVKRLTADLDKAVRKAESVNNGLTEDINRLNSQLSGLTAENEALQDLLEQERIIAEGKLASLAALETSWKESQEREEDLCRNLDIQKEQIDLLEAELGKYRRRESAEETLKLKTASLEREVATLQSELANIRDAEIVLVTLQNDMKSLASAKAEVEEEYIRMANANIEKETEMMEALYHAESEMQRLSRELELQLQIGEMERTALRDELRQLLLASGKHAKLPATSNPTGKPQVYTAPEPAQDNQPASLPVLSVEPVSSAPDSPETLQQTPIIPAAPSIAPVKNPEPVTSITVPIERPVTTLPPVAPPEPERVPEEDNSEEPLTGDVEIAKGLVNEFGSFFTTDDPSSTEFRIDRSLNCIEYSDPSEISAILYSSNSVQAVPDGGSVQRCKGYIIAIKKEISYKAYLVWHLTENGKVVICTPDQQPADATECTQVLLNAVSYFEIVGFMMEVADLGSTVKSYSRAIRKVPALVRK